MTQTQSIVKAEQSTPWHERIQSAYDDDGHPNYLNDKGELIEGIYDGLENDVYHSLDAYSSTMLKTLVKTSPAHVYREYYSGIERVRTTTQRNTLDTGSYGHELVLEPVGFYQRYFRTPLPTEHKHALTSAEDLKAKCKELDLKVSGTKKELTQRLLEHDPDLPIYESIISNLYQDALTPEQFSAVQQLVDEKKAKTLAEACEQHKKVDPSMKLPIDGMVWDDAHEIHNTFKKHARARRCISGGFAELTIISRCPTTGLLLKAKFDYINKYGIASDVKTTRSANPDKFAKQCRDLRYDVQESFYRYVATLQGVNIECFSFIALEYADASICELFEIASENRDKAYSDLNDALEQLNYCLETDDWFGYSKNDEVFVIKW